MNPSWHPRRRAERTARILGWIARCRSYVWIPQALIDHHRAHPLALALYGVYARLWMAWKGPDGVPVSDADLERFFPEICHGSLQSARAYLRADGWLIQARRGNKNTYTPTWGHDHTGQIRPWTREKGWNRQSCKTVRFNRDLLDYYVGRLLPDPAKPAVIERYIETPLRLATIGAIVVALRSHTITDATAINDLESHGLFCNGEWVMATTPREMLSQSACTDRGSRRLSQWVINPVQESDPVAPESTPPPSSATLFFGMGLINGLLNLLIKPCDTLLNNEFALGAAPAPSDWEPWDPTGNQGMVNSWNPPVPRQPTPALEVAPSAHPLDTNHNQPENGCSQSSPSFRPAQRRHLNIMSIPNTPTAALLRDIHVRPKQICELASMDATLVAQVIAEAQSRPTVASVAGWTVSVLRDIQNHGWNPMPQSIATEPSWDVIRAKAEPWFTERGMGVHEDHESDEPVVHATPEDDPRRPDWIPVTWWAAAPEEDRDLLAYVQRGDTTLYAPDVWRRGALNNRPALIAELLALPQLSNDACQASPEESCASVLYPPEDDPRRPDWIPVTWWAAAASDDRHLLAYVRRSTHTVHACDQWRQRRLRDRPDLMEALLALPSVQ